VDDKSDRTCDMYGREEISV